MRYEIVPNSCRICLRKSKKLRSIYKPLEDGDEAPKEMLQDIVGIALEEAHTNLALPKSICKSCELSLNLAFQFRTKALKSQRLIEVYCKQLLEKSENVGTTNSETALQVKEELEEFMELHDSLEEEIENEEDELNICSETKIEEFEMPICEEDQVEGEEQVEYLEESYLDFVVEQDQEEGDVEIISDKTKNKINMCNVDDIKHDVDSDTNNVSHSKSNQPNIKENLCVNDKVTCGRRNRPNHSKATNGKCVRNNKHSIVELKQQQRTIAKETFSLVKKKADTKETSIEKLSTKSKSIVKKEDEESGHICDICGNIYAKRGRMMDHRRHHNKELRYACELCDKRFHLREKLRKHMFLHKGGKPFKCSFCSRSFFYESVRKAHEAIHSGHKPYVCDVCSKPFAYSHALKKHKLIHADIKLYHCKYCDKDFRLQHHMKQHVETKMHQNAVKSIETAGQLLLNPTRM